MCFTKVFRTEPGHKYILVECSVTALCLPVMSKLPVINSCAINRTMIGMSIKRISVLNLCHVLKPFVKSTPGHYVSEMDRYTDFLLYVNGMYISRFPFFYPKKVPVMTKYD